MEDQRILRLLPGYDKYIILRSTSSGNYSVLGYNNGEDYHQIAKNLLFSRCDLVTIINDYDHAMEATEELNLISDVMDS